MIQLVGESSLSAAVLAGAGAILASVWSIRFRSHTALAVIRILVALIALLLTVAGAALLVALWRSDFRFEYVASYTERALPWGYKLAALWAGQQGSLLLWAWLMSVMSVAAVAGFRRLEPAEQAVAGGTLAAVVGFFAAMLLFTADPFQLTSAAPADGRGLNPMLQDSGMIIHPPLLFLGYAGCTIPFAVLVGVLVAGRRDNRWLAEVRRWLLLSWLFLTAGIVVGAWWAYIELGWGGYWAWDPVENASLLPWLTCTALLHSIMIQQHRGMFKVWNAALIGLTFLLCIVGTYLTRSGVIQSVHSFAPSLIGTFFLAFLVVTAAATAGLIAWRRRLLRPEQPLEGLVSREGAFLLGNVLLTMMMLTTLVGTIFPILSAPFTDESVTVKPAFYNRVVAPMALLLVAAMAIGPILTFGRDAASRIARNLLLPGAAAAAVTATVAIGLTANPWVLVCVALATLGTASVLEQFLRSLAARRRGAGEGTLIAALRLIDRDHRRYGGQVAHLGLMLLVIGVVGSSLFDREQVFRLGPGESAELGEQRLTFVGLERRRAVNFTAMEATVELRDQRGAVEVMRPQCRFYDAWSEQPNTEVAIRSTWRRDLYLSVVGWEDGGAITAIQVRVNPLVLWIWIGALVMAGGAVFCMLPPLLPRARVAEATVPAAAAMPSAPSVSTVPVARPQPAPRPALGQRAAGMEPI
jgi:cytochrome c-type biogenesis protein CcmF